MKRNLFLASAIVLAALSSCTKTSELDQSLESAETAQTPISFSTYASSATATKGTAINSNELFQSATTHKSFDVAALVSTCTYTLYYDEDGNDTSKIQSYYMDATSDGVKFFNLNTLTYDEGWSSTTNMYWPNTSRVLHFAACSPSGVIADDKDYTFEHDNTLDEYTYSFDYTVTDKIADQIDLMYALTSVDYLSPSDQKNKGGLSYITSGVNLYGSTTTEESAVNLHFKHALTQIAFTATKDSDLEVYVKSITLCNVYNSGKFIATSVTDDSETSSTNTTIGETNGGDKVNANNFGYWEPYFDTNGWGTLDTDYYTAEKVLGETTYIFYYADTDEGTQDGHSSMSHYGATLNTYNTASPLASNATDNSIKIGDTETALTSSTDVLMLMPQTLTAWDPTASTELNCIGFYTSGAGNTIDDIAETYSGGEYASSTKDHSLTYLAIDCEIYNSGYTDETAVLHDGYIFVPFETLNIDYSKAAVDTPETDLQNAWLPGYKITYCLNFGGGYVVEEGHTYTLPEPGCIPDTETQTLRSITYTTSVDTFVDGVDGDPQDQSTDDSN